MPTVAPPRRPLWFPGSSSFMRAGSMHEAEMIFAPDVTNHPPLRSPLPKIGEVRLLIAVLEQACDDLRWPHRRIRRGGCLTDCTPCAAQAWIDADERTWVFSFRCCCELLGLDASAVRQELRRA